MPQPWEFDIEFDDKTGHVKRVVAGDNGPYQQYIEAQNMPRTPRAKRSRS